MFSSHQYREKAEEYKERSDKAIGSSERREYHDLERTYTALANNGQWLSDDHEKRVQATNQDTPASDLAAEEEHVLRCLGASLIMQWNTLPTKLQRELFDTAGAMGDVLQTPELRGQIARFLHKHKDGDAGS